LQKFKLIQQQSKVSLPADLKKKYALYQKLMISPKEKSVGPSIDTDNESTLEKKGKQHLRYQTTDVVVKKRKQSKQPALRYKNISPLGQRKASVESSKTPKSRVMGRKTGSKPTIQSKEDSP
jgi:hypothetical protein